MTPEIGGAIAGGITGGLMSIIVLLLNRLLTWLGDKVSLKATVTADDNSDSLLKRFAAPTRGGLVVKVVGKGRRPAKIEKVDFCIVRTKFESSATDLIPLCRQMDAMNLTVVELHRDEASEFLLPVNSAVIKKAVDLPSKDVSIVATLCSGERHVLARGREVQRAIRALFKLMKR